jgi:hypothetical protein
MGHDHFYILKVLDIYLFDILFDFFDKFFISQG